VKRKAQYYLDASNKIMDKRRLDYLTSENTMIKAIDSSSESNAWNHEGSRNESGNITTNIRWTFKDGSMLAMDMEFIGSRFRYSRPSVLNHSFPESS
jgi:hypothetical protein